MHARTIFLRRNSRYSRLHGRIQHHLRTGNRKVSRNECSLDIKEGDHTAGAGNFGNFYVNFGDLTWQYHCKLRRFLCEIWHFHWKFRLFLCLLYICTVNPAFQYQLRHPPYHIRKRKLCWQMIPDMFHLFCSKLLLSKHKKWIMERMALYAKEWDMDATDRISRCWRSYVLYDDKQQPEFWTNHATNDSTCRPNGRQ